MTEDGDINFHKVLVKVEGVGYKSQSEFVVSDETLTLAVEARSLLGIELHERAVSVVEEWIHYVTTAPIPTPGGYKYPFPPQTEPVKSLRSKLKNWVLNCTYRYMR